MNTGLSSITSQIWYYLQLYYSNTRVSSGFVARALSGAGYSVSARDNRTSRGYFVRSYYSLVPAFVRAPSRFQYRMPSPAAWSRGQEAARKILEAHVADTGEFPETVAVRRA